VYDLPPHGAGLRSSAATAVGFAPGLYPNSFFIISFPPAPPPALSHASAFFWTSCAWPSPKALAKAGRSAHAFMYLAIAGVLARSASGKKIGTWVSIRWRMG
jgi:hypothetical protein